MWQFNWGTFWSVLAAVGVACFVIGGYISSQLECINKVLLGIEWKLDDVRSKMRSRID
jgi:hypothetical protein